MASFNTLALYGGRRLAGRRKTDKLVMIPQLHDNILLISIKSVQHQLRPLICFGHPYRTLIMAHRREVERYNSREEVKRLLG